MTFFAQGYMCEGRREEFSCWGEHNGSYHRPRPAFLCLLPLHRQSPPTSASSHTCNPAEVLQPPLSADCTGCAGRAAAHRSVGRASLHPAQPRVPCRTCTRAIQERESTIAWPHLHVCQKRLLGSSKAVFSGQSLVCKATRLNFTCKPLQKDFSDVYGAGLCHLNTPGGELGFCLCA